MGGGNLYYALLAWYLCVAQNDLCSEKLYHWEKNAVELQMSLREKKSLHERCHWEKMVLFYGQGRGGGDDDLLLQVKAGYLWWWWGGWLEGWVGWLCGGRSGRKVVSPAPLAPAPLASLPPIASQRGWGEGHDRPSPTLGCPPCWGIGGEELTQGEQPLECQGFLAVLAIDIF